MSNFFSFEEDFNIVKYPFDPSRPFRFKAYKGTPFFSIDGYSYPYFDPSGEVEPTLFIIEKAITIPKGEYEISINQDLKGNGDSVVLQNGSFSEKISSIPKKCVFDEQTELDLVFSFVSNSHYLFGDNYNEQEDFGKDYSIQINLISGGLYDRENETAVLKGDINEDGKITIEDLLALRVFSMGGSIGTMVDSFRLDINEDGVIDVVDLLFLRKYLTGTEFFSDIEFR